LFENEVVINLILIIFVKTYVERTNTRAKRHMVPFYRYNRKTKCVRIFLYFQFPGKKSTLVVFPKSMKNLHLLV